MSAESGISVDGELRDDFVRFKNGETRCFKVIIKEELMYSGGSVPVNGSFEEDFDKCVSQLVDDNPCYLMMRFDKKNADGLYEWLLFLYCPDNAKVRDKMKYASTRSSFRRNFESSLISEEIFTNKRCDLCLKGYKDHVVMKDAPTPLTEMETYAQEAKDSDHKFIAHNSSHTSLSGVILDVSSDVYTAFEEFANDTYNYVQMGVDIDTEKIIVFKKANIKLEEMASSAPSDLPRFHLFKFSYQHDGENKLSLIFIYFVPGFKCPIKQRMIYSSCKSHCIQLYEQKHGKFDKKLEVEDMNEVNQEKLVYEIHPVAEAPKKLFSKPKRPGRA